MEMAPGPLSRGTARGTRGRSAIVGGVEAGRGVDAVEVTPPFQHIDGDAKEDKTAGDLQGGQGDAEKLQEKAAQHHEQRQDEEGVEAGLPGQAPGGGRGISRRQGQIRKDVARRVDDDEQRDQAGDEKRPMSRQEAMFHDGNRLAGEG